MASIENYNPNSSKTKPRNNFLTGLSNAGLFLGDSVLSSIGLNDIINENSYKGDSAEKLDKNAKIVGTLGSLAAAIPTGGATLGGSLLKKVFKDGGMRNIPSIDNELIELQGNTHLEGGINIGNGDEAENKEIVFNSEDIGQFIFSEQLKVPNSKKSFADEAKKIKRIYENNTDLLREKAMKQRMGNLAALQESVKPKEKILGNKFDDGGLRFNLADALAFRSKLSKSDPLAFNNNNGLIKGNKLGENIGKQSVDFSKVKAVSKEVLQDDAGGAESKNMSALPQAIGYGAQALANIPGLFTKSERVKYDRVAPDLINLNAERNALTQDRDLSRALSRRAVSSSNNIGQALNFLGASESDISRQFGQNISKSFQTEANLNSEIKNKAKMFNAEISRAEQDANAAERDAARGTRLQSLANIGSIAALGAKDFMESKYKLAQLGTLDTGDFIYVFDKWNNPIKKEKKYNADGTWDGKSFKN